MEYAKDEIFQVRYNTKLDRLEFKKDGWTSIVRRQIKKHKFMTTVISICTIFSTLNFVLIYYFMKVLQGF